ncbi:AAA family ATPase [Aureimonas sp. AU20]|uniref:AAA family ATPase n=1 Tax=Aureimonas sp. AU20 TaxID=1349819 RepID=UPI0007214B2B|nr:AAA family ATPase [Aureimonas sp. AU20]ALN75723.1 hypothetical protein M673_23535 [Aureimonas sp. AU20]
MQTLAIASRKGGSGKTTTAVHIAGLADADGGCVIVDADPQGSASAWYELREAERPYVVAAPQNGIRGVTETAHAEGFAWSIIDLPPHNEASISEAMRLADLVLIPVRPSLFDLRAAESTISMARTLKKPAIAVITGAPPGMTGGEASIVKEARGYLASLPVDVCKATIGQRAAFSHALLSGSSAGEYEPEGKAARECVILWRELKERMK